MQPEDLKWKNLYKIGGTSALLAAVLLLMELSCLRFGPNQAL